MKRREYLASVGLAALASGSGCMAEDLVADDYLSIRVLYGTQPVDADVTLEYEVDGVFGTQFLSYDVKEIEKTDEKGEVFFRDFNPEGEVDITVEAPSFGSIDRTLDGDKIRNADLVFNYEEN